MQLALTAKELRPMPLSSKRCRAGFTLVEMTVVILLVILVASMAMPIVGAIIDMNAYGQAHTLMTAELRATRGSAMMSQMFVGLHHQRVDHDVLVTTQTGKTYRPNAHLKDRFMLGKVKPSVEGGFRLDAENEKVGLVGGWTQNDKIYDKITQSLINQYYATNKGDKVVIDLSNAVLHTGGTRRYAVVVRWGNWEEWPSGIDRMDPQARVTVHHAIDPVTDESKTEIDLDQSLTSREWVTLGTFPFDPNTGQVEIECSGKGALTFGSIYLSYQMFIADSGVARSVPQGMAFGELNTETYVFGADPTQEEFTESVFDGGSWGAGNESHNFATFTVMFSPEGKLVRRPFGQSIVFATGSAMFKTMMEKAPLWDPDVANNEGGGEDGASLLTLFSYADFKRAKAGGLGYLKKNAGMLPINIQIGELMRGD